MSRHFKISIFLAIKAIMRGNRSVVILTPLIIGLTVANLVFTSSLFIAMTDKLNNQLIDNLFSHVLIEPTENKTLITDPEGLMQKIKQVPNVSAVAYHFKTGADFFFDKKKDNEFIRKGAYAVISVDPKVEGEVTRVKQSIIEGEYLSYDDREGIVIGIEIAGGPKATFDKISLGGVKIGDKVRIAYPNNVTRLYRVKGIYKTGLDTIDNMAFVTHGEMEGVTKNFNTASEILVRTTPGKEDAVVAAISNFKISNIKINPWTVFSNYAATMSKSLDILNLILRLIGMLVAGVTILIVMFISIINKRRQLGILKAIGVPQKVIINSYLIQSFFFAMLGIVAGVVVLYLMFVPYFNLYPLDMGFGNVSLSINFGVFVFNSFLIIVTSILSGFLPVWKIARQDITKSIWGV